ncbi:cytochrome P450 [Nonomuraea sp. JJY05]|uniref:cytochrome P450 n=1 Tax=Nonomuraea sp. JJY05 TaxID=3350255 RepID=UPI00373F4643
MSKARPVPGPGWLTPLALPAYLLRGEHLLDRAFERYGEVFAFWAPGIGRVALMRDPALIGEVMTARLDPFDGRPTAAAWGPRSIFAQQGADHHRMRKLVLPLLGGRAVRRHREIVADVAGRTVDEFPAGKPFELLPLLWEALLEIALRSLLGLDRRRLEVWRPLVRELLNVALTEQLMVRFALRELGAIRLWPSARRLRARCVRLVRGEIARRHDGDTGDDILSLLMASRTAEGWRLNDEALVDQVLTMLLAGHTTTALGVAWAVERLVRHPSALHRLTAEALRGEDDRFATAVACETLRLRPSTSTVPLGVARERLTFGGYRVEPGTNLLVALRALHRHPRHFADPLDFRPERFLEGRPVPYSWLPFGTGPHVCVGRHFALLQISTFLHVVTRRVILSAADPRDEGMNRVAITHQPGRGCTVVAVPRGPITPPSSGGRSDA